MAEACAVPAAAYRKGEGGVRSGGWVEVVGQIGEHSVAGVTVYTEKGIVVTYAIDALTNVVRTEGGTSISSSESFDGTLFRTDVLLDVASGTALRIYFASG